MTDHILGPIDYLAVEFPGAHVTGEGFGILMSLVRQGTIRVLDLEFIMKAEDGSFSRVALRDVEHGADLDAALWDGAASGLLDETDLAAVAAAIQPGSLGGILVYENTWAVPLMTALDRSSALLVGFGRISAADVEAALGETPAS